MAEQNLHDASVDAVFQEPGSITMPERMRTYGTRDPCLTGAGVKRAPQRYPCDGSIAAFAGAQPAWMAMGLPETAQFVEYGLGQRHLALFVALANDAHQTALAIDGRDFEVCGFADAQAASIHQKQRGSGDRSSYAREDGAHFRVR